MKNLSRVFIGIMVCATSLLFSCKKERIETAELQSSTPAQPASASQCKPAVFGAYDGLGGWRTVAQKWYSNGNVKYLKAKFGGPANVGMNPGLEWFDLNWGEVSYEGNQVYLKDVLNNRILMRIAVDNQNRPVATYYNIMGIPNTYLRDTTYYFYDGDRLDYMISLFEVLPYGTTPIFGWKKFVFSYDSYGNLVKAEFPGNLRLNIQYDYTKPLTGIISNFQLTSSLKLLEFLELIKLPMHHAVTRTNFEHALYSGTPYEYFSEVFYAQYTDYIITDGLVRSCIHNQANSKVILYNGWDCATDPSANNNKSAGNAITNLQQFQQVYSKVEPHKF